MNAHEDSRRAALYLAIDQGGHASRAVIFDGRGSVQASAYSPIETLTPAPGRVEHDAEALIASVRDAVDQAARRLGSRLERLHAAGLATQRSSIVCWDRESGAALSPVISWQDRRMADWTGRLAAHAASIRARTGLRLSPHYGASKLRWCLDELPAVRAALAEGRLACGPVSSFILHRILDERPLLLDPANAVRTLLYDLQTRDWSPELLSLFGLPREPLPECTLSRYSYGHLSIGGRRLPLTVTTGDQSAAIYAAALPAPDTVFINVGTGAFLQRLIGDRPCDCPGLLSSVVWLEEDVASYVLEGAVNGAGSAVAAVAGELHLDSGEVNDNADGWLERCVDPPLFLNGVSGLGSPFWVADFPSRFIGEGNAADRMVAVLESIVFLLAVNLEVMEGGMPGIRRTVISGGLSRLDGLCQRLADVSRLPVLRPAQREATASGLAFLLAKGPLEWVQPRAAVFHPRKNTPLRARYECWRSAMEEELRLTPFPSQV